MPMCRQLRFNTVVPVISPVDVTISPATITVSPRRMILAGDGIPPPRAFGLSLPGGTPQLHGMAST